MRLSPPVRDRAHAWDEGAVRTGLSTGARHLARLVQIRLVTKTNDDEPAPVRLAEPGPGR